MDIWKAKHHKCQFGDERGPYPQNDLSCINLPAQPPRSVYDKSGLSPSPYYLRTRFEQVARLAL